ncbi:hypothetical protein L1049_023114 [Liquidambar formosana]|uniref:Spermidine hydroxycinnamoyl transferase n=1 Tax=Liquidambar formosana TaxID=63359 RepID=A0AAP0RDL7_LIQFO
MPTLVDVKKKSLSLSLSLSLSQMVSLKGSFTVKPAHQTPGGRMSLSDSDQTAAITHAPTVYFYRAASVPIESAIHTLRDSLSKALVIFYPLAGRLHWIGGARLELDCNAMGAQLLEAESEAKIDDFGDFRPTPQIRALIPSVDYTTPIHEIPLLLVQLTKFSCGGLSLGMAISHAIVDGISALHFVSEWAKIARGDQNLNPPFLDREILQIEKNSALQPRFDDHSVFSPSPLLIGQSDNMEERKKETTVAMLKLSCKQIEELKNKANEGLYQTNNSKTGRAYTRYEAVAGHIWRCASKARRHEREQLTRLRFVMNIRNRVHPPLPPDYFGNAIFPVSTTRTSSEELLSKPLCFASSKIREATDEVTDEYIRSSFAYVKTQPDISQFRNCHTVGCTQAGFFGNPNFEITSWVSLPLYGTDFGWGKDIQMVLGAIGSEGKCYILPDHNEDGSFVIALRLQVAHMEAFKMFFYNDI